MHQEEWVDWVDEQNRVIAAVPRSQMRREHLPHRASYIFIIDSNSRLYVQRRTLTKDYCPGMLDACCGGVVQAGEAILPSALRELEEEMGIRDTELTAWGDAWLVNEQNRVWASLFSCHYDGELTLQQSEVDAVLMMSEQEIEQRAAEFTPDSIAALHIWQQRRERGS